MTRAGADPVFEAAAHWLVRIADHPLSPTEDAELRRWLAADRAHPAALDAAQTAWVMAGDLRDRPGLAAERRRARSFRLASGAAIDRSPRRRVVAAGALAATLALAIVARPPAAQAYETARGQSLRAVLADGSVVQLNTDSRAVMRYGWLVNRLTIERGEAQVSRAGGLGRPLRLHVNDVVIEAGRSVAVRDYGTTAAVLAVDGNATVHADGRKVTLAPAQRAAAAPGRPLAVTAAEPSRLLAWQRGEVVFDRTPLAEALAEFGRYGDQRLAISPEAARLRVSGVYRTADLRAFLDALPAVHPVRWRHVAPGEIRVERTAA